MRRTSILILCALVLGATAWWLTRTFEARSVATTADTRCALPEILGLPLSQLDAPTLIAREGEAAPVAPAPTEPREVAGQPAPIQAAHALLPEEPTLVTGRVVDRNAAPQRACLVLAAPRMSAPPAQLKTGHLWPLDAAAIDRDGARARLREGKRDPDSDRDDELARVRKVSTDSDGRFEIRGLPSGPIRLALRSDVLAPRDLDDLVLEARGTLELGELILDTPLILEGQVLDTDGRAIAGARIVRVDAFDVGAPMPGSSIAQLVATTAANGRFRTTPLAHGAWSLLATHAEYLAQRIDGVHDDPARLPPAITYTLSSGIALRGNVFGPEPDELATLYVLAAPERTWRDPATGPQAELAWESPRIDATADQRVARVAADGSFRLSGLDPKRAHTLRLGPLAVRGDELACVYLSARADAGARDIDLVLARGATLSFEARTLGSEAPIEDFEARLVGAAPETLVDTDDVIVRHHPGGTFRLTGMRFPAAAPQKLTIAALGHAQYTQDVYAVPGGDIALGTVLLAPLTTVEVTVTDATSGAPIEGARVSASEADPASTASLGWPSDTTDGEGIAHVTSLCGQGSYVWVTADGLAPNAATIDEFRRNSNGASCNVRLSRGARVRVHVLDREGTPVSGVTVAAWEQVVAKPPVVSDSEGIATFEHLYPGLTRFACVLLRTPAPDEASTELYVGHDAEQDAWITSPGVGRLVGRVLDDTRPVIGAELTLWALDAYEWKFQRRSYDGVAGRARSDSTGAFRFESVEPGPFVIAVRVEAALDAILFDVDVGASEKQLDIDIAGARMRGRVVDARGRAQAGAIVSLSLEAGLGGQELTDTLDRRGELWFMEHLGEMVSRGGGSGRVGPRLTTDANGAFEFFAPLDANDLVLFASHARGGVGWTRLGRRDGPTGTHETTIALTPSGALELGVGELTMRNTCLVVLLPEAEPSGWLVREVRFGETTRWNDLAAGTWKAWIIGITPGSEIEEQVLGGSHTIEIEAGHTTEAHVELQ